MTEANPNLIQLTTETDKEGKTVKELLKDSLEWAAENKATECIVFMRNTQGETYQLDTIDDPYRAIGIVEVWKSELMLALLDDDDE
jgi:hypothetical protein